MRACSYRPHGQFLRLRVLVPIPSLGRPRTMMLQLRDPWPPRRAPVPRRCIAIGPQPVGTLPPLASAQAVGTLLPAALALASLRVAMLQ